VLRWYDRLEEGLIAFLLALMTLITFGQVIARYVFDYSFVWALELVTFLFAWLIFLGMSYGVRAGSHIGVDALVKALGPRSARIVGAVAALCCFVYAVIVLTGSWRYVSTMHMLGTLAQDLPIPVWIPQIVLPLGFALLAMRFAEVFYRIIRGSEAHLLGDEAAAILEQVEATEGTHEGAEKLPR
jgi:C4-dicarboxylate transporter DctQ subunit